MEKKKWYKNKLFIGAAAVVVILVIVVFFMKRAANDYSPAPLDFTPKSGEVVLTGSIVCLPIREGTPANTASSSNIANLNCVRGLKTSDGRTLALDTARIGGPEVDMAPGTRVRAVGSVVPANTDSSENIFIYDGLLTARGLVRD